MDMCRSLLVFVALLAAFATSRPNSLLRPATWRRRDQP